MSKLFRRLLCFLEIHNYSIILMRGDEYAVRQCYNCKSMQTRFGRGKWMDGYFFYDL